MIMCGDLTIKCISNAPNPSIAIHVSVWLIALYVNITTIPNLI